MSDLIHQSGLLRPQRLKTTIMPAFISGATVTIEFCVSMLKLAWFDVRQRQIVGGLHPGRCLYIAGGRNEIGVEFLKTPADALLFIDTDIDFEPEQVYGLVDALDSDHQIVSGLYFSRWGGGVWPVWHTTDADGELQTAHVIHPGLQEVAAVGMGFTLIHRKVLEGMADRYQHDEWKWFGHDLIQTRKGPKRMGEDITFCLRAKELGYKVWGHGGIRVKHVKTQTIDVEVFKAEIAARTALDVSS